MARKAKRAAARGKKGKTSSRAAKRKVTAKKAPPKRAEMIDLFTDTTPNGYKISIFLEEAKLPYTTHYVDISTGDQFKPEFLAISPNNKIPAITDRNGPPFGPKGGKHYSLFESGAILLYLAEKTGKFLPKTERGRHDVIQWLMFQMGNIGPMLGQVHHFRAYAPEKIPYAINRYTNEANRLYGVMDKRLAKVPYLAGAYSIADMTMYSDVHMHGVKDIGLGDYPNLKRWHDTIEARPAIQRAWGPFPN